MASLWDRRRADAERALWESAAGGIVTTEGQARAIRAVMPGLNVLVRPNGYSEVEIPSSSRRVESEDELRVAHFGDLYAPRIDISGFLRRLAASKVWRRVVLYQYGRDAIGMLEELSDVLRVEVRPPILWNDVVRFSATAVDLALVVGNKDARQLPSKAVEYMTLPVPRLAVTLGAGDALSEYVGTKRGWLVLSADTVDPGPLVAHHVRRQWTAEELSPSPEEAWNRVAAEIAGFVRQRCLDARH
jgi:hypothetical protein